MSKYPSIEDAIDEVILTAGNAVKHFESLLKTFESIPKPLLNRCRHRLIWQEAKEVIDRSTLIDESEGGWHVKPVWSQLDEPSEEEMLYEADHPLYSVEFKDQACCNWLIRRERELWDVLCLVHLQLNITAPICKERVGLEWTRADNDKLELFADSLLQNELINEESNRLDLIRSFNGSKPKMNPPIRWMSTRATFCYLIAQLKRQGLIHSDNFDDQITKGNLFHYSTSAGFKPIRSIRRTVSHYWIEERGKSKRDASVFTVIDAIIKSLQ